MYNKGVHSIYHIRKALSMKKNNTKPANVQTENTADDLRKSMDAAARFFDRFGVVKLLGECGAYKEKGVPVRVILLYIFNLMFSPMSMYYQIKMGAFHEDFSKNTVYRFLENIHMNWHMFLLRLSASIIRYVAGLTDDKNNRYALLVDDTPLPKCGKAMELVSKYFNHATMGYEFGYRVLTLAWTDGVTTVPVRYSLLASSYDEKVRGTIKDDIDGRSLGGRIRKLARTSMNGLAVKFACEAVKSGIPASIIAFDSWFAVPQTISRLMKQARLTVIARLKTNAKQYYEHDGKMINIKALYTMSKKRRGKSVWKLSVRVNLLVKEKNKIIERIPVKLVYLPNRANSKEWICLLSTDTEMDENEIIRQYGRRWNIEVMFKCSKQYLNFGKDFQALSFEAQNAQIAIAFARYMLIAIEQRESEDYRSCGELFMLFCQELQDITFIKALALIVELFKEGMMKLLGITEAQIQSVVDYVISALPGYLQRSLSAANGIAQAA
jgi:hypothetical protein